MGSIKDTLIIKYIISFFKPIKQMRLGESTETIPFICIDMLESIIHDENVFNKFMRYEQNITYFGGRGFSKNNYLNTLRSYIKCTVEYGKVFSKEEEKRIKKIFPREKISLCKSSSANIFKEWVEVLNSTELTKKVIDIGKNTDNFEMILQSPQMMALVNMKKQFNNEGIVFSEIQEKNYAAILTNLENRKIEKENQLRTREMVNMIRKEMVKCNLNIDSELENYINAKVDEIGRELEPLEKARIIYVELNKILTYSLDFLALRYKQLTGEIDNYENKQSQILNKDISEINLQEPEVICKTWAEIYTAFLNKNNINACVYKPNAKQHWLSVFEIEGKVFEADGTQTIKGKNGTKLNDLTRAKINETQILFKEFRQDDNEEIIKEIDKKIGYEDEDTSLEKLLLEYEGMVELKNFVIDDSTKIQILSEVIDKSGLQGSELLTYFMELSKRIYKNEKKFVAQVIFDEKELVLLHKISQNDEKSYLVFENSSIRKISKEEYEQKIKLLKEKIEKAKEMEDREK